jgi:hypothetical protein
MTEEQGDRIIELLEDMNRNLRNIDSKLPEGRMFRSKDLTDIYDKLDDVVSAVDNVERAVDSIS